MGVMTNDLCRFSHDGDRLVSRSLFHCGCVPFQMTRRSFFTSLVLSLVFFLGSSPASAGLKTEYMVGSNHGCTIDTGWHSTSGAAAQAYLDALNTCLASKAVQCQVGGAIGNVYSAVPTDWAGIPYKYDYIRTRTTSDCSGSYVHSTVNYSVNLQTRQVQACPAGRELAKEFFYGWATDHTDSANIVQSTVVTPPTSYCNASCEHVLVSLDGASVDTQPSPNGFYAAYAELTYATTGAECSMQTPDPSQSDPPSGGGTGTPPNNTGGSGGDDSNTGGGDGTPTGDGTSNGGTNTGDDSGGSNCTGTACDGGENTGTGGTTGGGGGSDVPDPNDPGSGSGSGSDPSGGGSGTSGGGSEVEGEDCPPGSDLVSCATLGEGEGEIPTGTHAISFQEESWLTGGGSCPSDLNIAVLGISVRALEMQPICTKITTIVQPLAILLALFTATMIVSGVRSET